MSRTFGCCVHCAEDVCHAEGRHNAHDLPCALHDNGLAPPIDLIEDIRWCASIAKSSHPVPGSPPDRVLAWLDQLDSGASA